MHIGIWENQKERNHHEDLDIDERIILRCILEKQDKVVWTGFIWLRRGPVESFGEHGNAPFYKMLRKFLSS
jgi:hypothetical protein